MEPVAGGGSQAGTATESRALATGLIFCGVVLATTGAYAAVTMAPVVARDLTGSAFLAGLPVAALLAGAGGGAAATATAIRRWGRRAVLSGSYTLGAAACVLTIGAVAAGSFGLLLAGLLGIGSGHAANQMARYSAAELHAPARRPSVIGWIVWAQAVGAVAGPLLLGPAGRLGPLLHAPPEIGGFVLGAGFFAVAAMVHALRPRPRANEAAPPAPPAPVPLAVPASPWRLPAVRIAIAAMVTGQVVMLLVMTMTPVHARGSGHELAAVGAIMSAHTLGMFGLAPVAGRMAGRFGSVRVIALGVALLAAGAVWAAAAPAAAHVPLSGALFLLGLGWSFGFVAGSTLLTETVDPDARPAVQARVEALTWISGAAASVASGLLLGLVGYALLCLFGATLLAVPVAVIMLQRRALVAGGAASR